MAVKSSEQNLRSLKANTDVVKQYCTTYADLTKISYTWTIHNFSFLQTETGDPLLSPIFSAGANNKYKWRLKVYQNGYEARDTDNLSLYLRFIPSEKTDVEAKFDICLLNEKKEILTHRQSILHKFSPERNSDWGWYEFVKKSFLHNAANCLLPDDSFTIQCNISIYEGTIDISDPEEFNLPECPILNDLTDLFESQKLSDVTLITLSREFQAHKLILAMRSPVFSAMFEHDMLEQKENRVNIADVDDVVLMELLRFIYTGKTINLEKMAEGLLAAADKYELESLKTLCEKTLSKGFTIENAASLLILGDFHGCVQLKARTLIFISMHIKEILETSSYKSMCDTHPYLINEILRAFVAPEATSGSGVVARN